MVRSASRLEKAGADFIIMPCHTAHLWIKELRNSVKIPFYSMVENTAQVVLAETNGQNEKILLLATTTTVNSNLYQNEFKNSNISLITPLPAEQRLVDDAIHSVKAGKLGNSDYIGQLNSFLEKYRSEKVSAVLGCCTEVPLMYPYLKVKMLMIDPTLMLAKFAVSKASDGLPSGLD